MKKDLLSGLILEEEELPSRGGEGRGLDMSEALSCPGQEMPDLGCRMGALYLACAHNDPAKLQAVLDAGISPEEATQVDSNGRVRQQGSSFSPPHCLTLGPRVPVSVSIGWILRTKEWVRVVFTVLGHTLGQV